MVAADFGSDSLRPFSSLSPDTLRRLAIAYMLVMTERIAAIPVRRKTGATAS
jgi:hypothetical protein